MASFDGVIELRRWEDHQTRTAETSTGKLHPSEQVAIPSLLGVPRMFTLRAASEPSGTRSARCFSRAPCF